MLTGALGLPIYSEDQGCSRCCSPKGLVEQVSQIRKILGLDDSLSLTEVLAKANHMMGFATESTLRDQTKRLLKALGV